MAKVIVGLLTIMLVASLVSGCYQAPAPAPIPAPAPAPPPAEPAPAPAAFTTSNLTISPTEVDSGKSVTISVLVSNTGGLTGSYKVTLKIDNVAVATEDVTLTGGASQTVTFITAKDVAGSYTVNVDSLSGTFTVKTAPAPVASTTHQVTIKDFAFSPFLITINVGDTVTWTNRDSVSHTVTGSGFDSGNLGSGQSSSHTFQVAGAFTYKCSIHPYMQGQVTIGSGSQSTSQNGSQSDTYSY